MSIDLNKIELNTPVFIDGIARYIKDVDADHADHGDYHACGLDNVKNAMTGTYLL